MIGSHQLPDSRRLSNGKSTRKAGLMYVNIDIKLGEVDFAKFDPAFQKSIEDLMTAHEEAGLVNAQSSLYRRLTESYRDLTKAVGEVLAGRLGDAGRRESFTLVITVEGDKRVFPPGPRAY
jgi:hypothetical protein